MPGILTLYFQQGDEEDDSGIWLMEDKHSPGPPACRKYLTWSIRIWPRTMPNFLSSGFIGSIQPTPNVSLSSLRLRNKMWSLLPATGGCEIVGCCAAARTASSNQLSMASNELGSW